MKNMTIFMLSLLVTVPVVSEAQTDFWQQVYPRTSSSSITLNEYTNFAIGFDGQGHLLLTTVDPSTRKVAIVKSTDDGLTWSDLVDLPDSLGLSGINQFAMAPNGEIFGGAQSMFRTTDNGDHWLQLPLPNPPSKILGTTVNSQGHLFVLVQESSRGARGRGIYRSTDSGRSWSRKLPYSFRYAPFYGRLHTLPGSKMFASFDQHAFISSENGRNWHATLPRNAMGPWVLAATQGGDFLASSILRQGNKYVPQLLQSTDGGKRWKSIHTFPCCWGSGEAMGLVITSDNAIYELFGTGGVYRSTDGGVTFAAVNDGLSQYNTLERVQLAISPSGYLYVYSCCAGLYRSCLPVGSPANPPTVRNSIADEGIPSVFGLHQNYPNPFNPQTSIRFDLPKPAVVTLKVYNVLGEEVAKLLNAESMDEGEQSVQFIASNYASGVYFYRIEAQSIVDGEKGTLGQKFVSVRKMMLVK